MADKKQEPKRALWLTFYGIFVALLIQVFYDFFRTDIFLWIYVKTIVFLVVAIIGILILWYYAFNGYSWRKGTIKVKQTPEKDKSVLEKENIDWNKRREDIIKLVDENCHKKRFIKKRDTYNKVITIVTIIIIVIMIAFNTLIVVGMMSYSNFLNDVNQPINQTAGNQTTHASSISPMPSIPAGLNYLGQNLPSVDAIFIGIVAALISVLALIVPLVTGVSRPEELADEYYNELSTQISNDDKPFLPLLKALINMKCKEFDVSLLETYHNSIRLKNNLFSENSLLKSLYSD
jgi:hypothetical protein